MGAGVRGGDGAEDLASACVVEVDLVGLLEGGELGADFGDGEGWGHDCVVEGRNYRTLTLKLVRWYEGMGYYELRSYIQNGQVDSLRVELLLCIHLIESLQYRPS